MSMIGNYYMTSEVNIKKIIAGDLLVEALIYDETDDINEDYALDIDKSWHAIHYVLTGESDEGDGTNLLSKVVLGGIPINDEDVGYGPASLISVKEVKMIATAIKDISKNDFRSKFNVSKMYEEEIYPIIDDENV